MIDILHLHTTGLRDVDESLQSMKERAGREEGREESVGTIFYSSGTSGVIQQAFKYFM